MLCILFDHVFKYFKPFEYFKTISTRRPFFFGGAVQFLQFFVLIFTIYFSFRARNNTNKQLNWRLRLSLRLLVLMFSPKTKEKVFLSKNLWLWGIQLSKPLARNSLLRKCSIFKFHILSSVFNYILKFNTYINITYMLKYNQIFSSVLNICLYEFISLNITEYICMYVTI